MLPRCEGVINYVFAKEFKGSHERGRKLKGEVNIRQIINTRKYITFVGLLESCCLVISLE